MMSNQTITILGAGNIGAAVIGGLIRGGDVPAENIRATRRSATALDELAARFPGIAALTDNANAVEGADVVVLAVKPRQAIDVVTEIRPRLAPNALVISMLAGITTESIGGALGSEIAVIRAMPNTPALVDHGATAISAGRFATHEHLSRARAIFEAVGIVEIVAEDLMDAVTGLSGSGPAYIYMVIEALTDGGVKQGLPRPQALRLAAHTVLGAAKLAIETGKHPAILRDEVTTPGGTAIAAVANLESHGLRTMLINAVATATDRSRELSKLAKEEG
ncbi:pyrroline-5-carboxylate reductase [soil metagenome]